MSDDSLKFHWADYLTFTLSVLLSVAVGVYYAFFHKFQTTTDEFLLANHQMRILPVSFSLFLSYMSAISFLGDPVEVYQNGAVHILLAVGQSFGIWPVAQYFAPKFHGLSLVSCYEQLERVYNKPFRVFFSAMALILYLPYLGLTLYAPSLAVAHVTHISIEGIIVIMGLVVVFYSSLGGMKAVVWTDTLQMVILCIGYLAMMIAGLIEIGGFSGMWDKAVKGGRVNFSTEIFNPSPFVKSSFWTYLIGGFFRILCPYISTQPFIQRYSSVNTPRDAKIVTWLNLPMYLLFVTCFVITGLIIFAYFGDCDPLEDGRIEQADQMVPLMVMETLGFLYGIPGLFMAGIFSASMSSLSSSLSAIAAAMLKDMIEPCYHYVHGKPMTDRSATIVAMAMTLFWGLVIMALAVMIGNLPGNLFIVTLALTGLVMGPQGGVFFMALLFPWVNWWSSLTGFILAIIIPAWIAIGHLTTDVSFESLPIYTHNCSAALNETLTTTSEWYYTTTELQPEDDGGFDITNLYYWSPLLYACLAFLITVFTALILGSISWCLCDRKKKNFELESQEEMEQKSLEMKDTEKICQISADGKVPLENGTVLKEENVLKGNISYMEYKKDSESNSYINGGYI